MITFLKTWANQIIVAVIIATIIEMILPNGNNKKYIKMVIGIYVLFTIIQPVFSKVTGESIEISNFNYEKYFDEEVLESSSEDFKTNNSKLIQQAYIDNIKSDIKTKINQKGYEASNISIDIITDENNEQYGTIENISLKISRIEAKENEKEEINNTIEIENVDINIGNNNVNNAANNVVESSSITNTEKTEIIEYLSNEYSIDKKNIVIN